MIGPYTFSSIRSITLLREVEQSRMNWNSGRAFFKYIKRDAQGTARTEIAIGPSLGLVLIVLIAAIGGWHVGVGREIANEVDLVLKALLRLL
jgi:hypothetical protein